jgi:hypothetical protein
MKVDELQNKLIAAARAQKPDDRVPYAFEKRITALIQARSASYRADLWVRGLWRAAVSCVVLAAICGIWALCTPATSASPSDDLSQSFENTLLASVDQNDANP